MSLRSLVTRDWDYSVKGYGVTKRPHLDTEVLLVHTTHMGKVSRDAEITAWVSRIAKGDKITRVKIISHKPPLGLKTLILTKAQAQSLLKEAENGLVPWEKRAR